MSKVAKFTNFTNEDFTGYWNGKARTFKPGESLFLDDYEARNYAKHLSNRELLRTDAKGNLKIKDGDKFTSPKFPEQVPAYMELFNKAYSTDEESEVNSSGEIENLNRSMTNNIQDKK